MKKQPTEEELTDEFLEKFCNFCGEKKELRPLGEAKVCTQCYLTNKFKRPSGKDTPTTIEDFDSGTVTEAKYADYMNRLGKRPIISHIAK